MYCKTFNSFPVAAGQPELLDLHDAQLRLSILSQLLPEAPHSSHPHGDSQSFNSFPVAAGGSAPRPLHPSGCRFQFFPSCCRGLCLVAAYKLFLFPSEVCKTASHYPFTHEKLLALPTSGFASPVLKRELLPCSLLKIRLPTGSFWIK